MWVPTTMSCVNIVNKLVCGINKPVLITSGRVLTVNRSSGKFFPLSIPLFIIMNLSIVGLSLTLGLCRLVCSMMTE